MIRSRAHEADRQFSFFSVVAHNSGETRTNETHLLSAKCPGCPSCWEMIGNLTISRLDLIDRSIFRSVKYVLHHKVKQLNDVTAPIIHGWSWHLNYILGDLHIHSLSFKGLVFDLFFSGGALKNYGAIYFILISPISTWELVLSPRNHQKQPQGRIILEIV